MAYEDILFGKNRHMFGGIEPSNMLVFEPVSDHLNSAPITMRVQIPSDTVINGQTLCTVAGAVIRRRRDRYPKDEFDGELVATITTHDLLTITDEGVTEIEGMYHYAAFPYSTQGVYNRSSVNRFLVNEPWPLDNFSVGVFSTESGNRAVNIQVAFKAVNYDPLAGVMIRKSTSGYPTDENDGEYVTTLSGPSSQSEVQVVEYVDESINKGRTYYYSAFPYMENGDVNRSLANKAECYISPGDYLFGYDLDVSDSNPATRVSYPSGVDNYAYNPAKMDFDNRTLDYGGWPSNAGVKFMPKPCMLNFDGTVREYLNPNDYTKNVDGNTSLIYTTAENVNAMMEWPKIWTKRWEENGVYHFRCSDVQIDESYECWCNYNYKGEQVDHFYTAIFLGKKITTNGVSTIRSMAYSNSTNLKRTVNLSYDGFVKATRATGNGWDMESYADRLLIQDLLIMMGKTTNLASVYGAGSSYDTPTNENNYHLKRGLFSVGYDYANSTSVQIFGMEHLWGCLHRFITGVIYRNGILLAKYTRSTVDGSTATDYNNTGDGYLSLYDPDWGIKEEGYISACITTSMGRIPYECNGSSSTYECSYMDMGSDNATYVLSLGDTTPLSFECVMFPDTYSDVLGAAISYK